MALTHLKVRLLPLKYLASRSGNNLIHANLTGLTFWDFDASGPRMLTEMSAANILQELELTILLVLSPPKSRALKFSASHHALRLQDLFASLSGLPLS